MTSENSQHLAVALPHPNIFCINFPCPCSKYRNSILITCLLTVLLTGSLHYRSTLYLMFDMVTLLVFIFPQSGTHSKKSQSCSSSESSGGDTEILDSSSTSSNHGDDNKSITETEKQWRGGNHGIRTRYVLSENC